MLCETHSPGHEFSGTVAALGEGVDGVNVGDRVVIFPASDDGCFYCENEIYGACHRWGFMGYSGGGEGMQEYTCVPQKSLHFLPSNVPLEIGALVEPLAVAWHAVKLANPGPVDITLVLGAGGSLKSFPYTAPGFISTHED